MIGLAMLSFVSFCSFAMDRVPVKKQSGEIVCFGNENATMSDGGSRHTNFSFRNTDETKAVSFTRIRLYTENGQLVKSMLPEQFPVNFKESLGPNAASTLIAAEILPAQASGQITLRVNFISTDGTRADPPNAVAAQTDFDSNNRRIGRDISECVYSKLNK